MKNSKIDIQAAIGREQLKRLPSMVERRRYLAARYSELLAGTRGLEIPREPPWVRSNWQSYCVRLSDDYDQHQVMQDLLDAGKPFGLRPDAILPAYGMAETTLAVSFSECGAGLVVDEVDADLLAALRRAVPATKGNTRRLASLGPLLKDLEARIIDEHGNVMPARGVGVIELRGESLTPGYLTMGGFIPAQDEHGWYDTGDLGYQMDNGHIVVCGRVKDVIIMAGRNIYPTDIERGAGRVEGVRPGCAVAVRLDAGHSRETFAVAVESNAWQDPVEVRRIEHQVAHEVVAEVDVRPRNVVVLGPGTIPKTPSGKLRRSTSVSLVT